MWETKSKDNNRFLKQYCLLMCLVFMNVILTGKNLKQSWLLMSLDWCLKSGHRLTGVKQKSTKRKNASLLQGFQPRAGRAIRWASICLASDYNFCSFLLIPTQHQCYTCFAKRMRNGQRLALTTKSFVRIYVHRIPNLRWTVPAEEITGVINETH